MTMDQMLTCSLCLEIFASPQTFPCFHSFCLACIQKLPLDKPPSGLPQPLDSGGQGSAGNPLRGYLCPLCRAFAREEDVRGNFLVKELLHMYRAKCEQKAVCLQCCEGVDSQWKCADCLIELCEKCHLSHLRIPVCRGHRVVPLDSQTEGVIDRLVFCTVHSDQPVMLNCADCEAPLCIKCKVTEHEAHRTETVERAVDRLRPLLQGQRQRIGGKLQELENELREMSRVVQDTTDTFSYCRESIEEKKQSLIAHIESEAAGQLTRLREKEEVETGKLSEKQGQIQNKIKEYCMLQDWIGTTLEKTRGAILLVECQSGLQQKVEKLVQQNGSGSAIKIEQPTYLSNPVSAKSHGLMGRIEYNQISFSSILPNLAAIQQTVTPAPAEEKTHLLTLHRANKTIHTRLDALLQRSWTTETELRVTEGHCAKVRAIGNELWLPLFNQNMILVYSTSGEFLRKVTHESIRHPIAVESTERAVVLVASESGLFSVNAVEADGDTVTSIKAAAMISDVCVRGTQMAALEYGAQQNQCQVHLYLEKEGINDALETKGASQASLRDCHIWVHNMTVCFSVPNIDKFSALLLKNDSVLVCPSNSHRIYSHCLTETKVKERSQQKSEPTLGGDTHLEISLHTGASLGTTQQESSIKEETHIATVPHKLERKAKASSLPSELKGGRTHENSFSKPPIYPMKSPHTPQLQRKTSKSTSLPENGLSSNSGEPERGLVISKTGPKSGVLNSGSNVLSTLTEYGCQGLQRAGHLYFPMMCGLDTQGSILVADCHNHRLQVLKENGQWEVVETLAHGNETLEDVVVVSENVIWVLQNWNRLVKYTCTQ